MGPHLNHKLIEPQRYWTADAYSREMLACVRVWNFACLRRDLRPGAILDVQVGAFAVSLSDTGTVLTDGWEVETLGEFVFVRMGGGEGLSAYLGEYADLLQLASISLDREIAHIKSTYAANWKICTENSLDEYHAVFVHPTTFRPMIDVAFDYAYSGSHSSVSIGIKEGALTSWKRIERAFRDRPYKTERYEHFFIFPNLLISSFYGGSFAINTFTPLEPEKTRFDSRVFLAPKVLKGAGAEALVKMFTDSSDQFGLTVVAEDCAMCEGVQQGIKQAFGLGAAGAYEQRLCHFQQVLNGLLGSSAR